MAKLQLTYAGELYDRLVPLFTKEVEPQNIELNCIPFHGSYGIRNMFDRMGGNQEFDCSEMSSSEFITRMVAGNCPFVAIPVFPCRVFRHAMMAINRKGPIKTPKDLQGKRIGIPLYTMTAAVTARGVLQHEYGIDLSTIEWVQGAFNKLGSHGNPTTMPLLRPVKLTNTTDKSLGQMLVDGDIAATMGSALPEVFFTNPDIVRLFPDYETVERDYFKRTRIFPIMHLVVIRKAIYEKHPWVASSLYHALNESKKRQIEHMRESGHVLNMDPWMHVHLKENDETFGGDAFPYGIEPNRPTLEAMVQWLHEQGMIPERIPIESIFVPAYDSL